MAGQIRIMIDKIIEQRAKGNAIVALTTRTKFVLKGIQLDRFNRSSPDDPVIIAKLKTIAEEMGVEV